MDSNGDITVTGGKVIVYGASTGADQPIDQDGQFKITGGTLFAAGSNEMGGGISVTNSQQYVTYSNTIASGKIITITDSSNNEVFSIENKKEVRYMYFTSSGSGFSVNIKDSSSTEATSTTTTATTASTTTITNVVTTATNIPTNSSSNSTENFTLINFSEMYKISYLYGLLLLFL